MSAGRRHVHGPAPIVDLVLREVSNPWAIEIIAGAVEAARRMHATVAVHSSPGHWWARHVA